MKHVFLTFILTILALLPTAALASVTPVGDLEFNNLSLGVNNFTVNNFTGVNNFPPEFPVADNVTFDNVVLTATEKNGTVLTFDLGNLGPGTDSSATVADSLSFTMVVFSATLDPSTFSLTPSGTFVAVPTLSYTLLPASGLYLAAGEDFGTINAINASPTPEPATFTLFALGLLGMLGVRARKYLLATDRG